MAQSCLQGCVLTCNFFFSVAVITANKHAFGCFPFPGALTAVHYLLSWAGVEALLKAGAFERKPIDSSHRHIFVPLIIAWSLGNTLSNVSLEKNSVGFYQMMKILVTPAVVAVDWFAYGKVVGCASAIALALTCAGVGVATVNDLALNARGAAFAVVAVTLSTTQKILNSHMQQRCHISTLQLLHQSLPWMSLLSIIVVPLLDSPSKLLGLGWLSARCVALVLSSAVAAFGATWSATRIFGLIGALAHVLLGQVKTCSVLILGVCFFDAPPNAKALGGAVLAVASITWYTVAAVRAKGAGAAVASQDQPDDRSDEGAPLRSTA